MKTLKCTLFISVMMLFSCEEKDAYVQCYSGNPFEELSWLNDHKESIKANGGKGKIIQFKYQNQDVFLVDNCYECPDGMIEVFNCDGKNICAFGGIAGLNTCPDFEEKAKEEKVLLDTTN